MVIKRNGVVIRQSLKTSDRTAAGLKIKELVDKHSRLRVGAGQVTFGDLADEWKDVVLASRDLKSASITDRENNLSAIFREWPGLRSLPIRSISATDCERWAAKRRSMISAQRYNNELGALRMVFDFAIREGFLAENPAKPVERARIPKVKILIPTREQFAAIVSRLRELKNEEAALFLELLAYSGMRVHEAASLRWDEIDYANNVFHVTGGEYGTKNGDHRTVPLFPALKALLERTPRIEGRPTVAMIQQCKLSYSDACKHLNLPHFTHHSLRHFFVSNAIEAGIDFKAIADWVGHKDGGILVAKTYGHLRQEHSAAMAERMNYAAKV
jgi:integrase